MGAFIRPTNRRKSFKIWLDKIPDRITAQECLRVLRLSIFLPHRKGFVQTIDPSIIFKTRSDRFAKSSSWVMTTRVFPDFARWLNISKMISLFTESRLPVGSSAMMMSGSFINARAIATRCCCPPESLEASLCACSLMSNCRNFSIAFSWMISLFNLSNFSAGNMRFCSTVNSGKRK